MNKDLFVDGKNYISANRAAKKLGYSQDYIGQLIRDNRVDGRMFGRTWYVDEKSLLGHKKNRGGKRSKNKARGISVGRAIRANSASDSKRISYASEPVPAFPELSKPRAELLHAQGVVLKAVATLMSVAVIFMVFFAWFQYESPAQYADVRSQAGTLAASAYESGSGFLAFIENGISKKLHGFFGASTASVPRATAANEEGIVAMPDQSDHDALVNRVKDSFSDPVNVTVDPDGNSGVITPVFRPDTASDTENYAFVMVPVSTPTK